MSSEVENIKTSLFHCCDTEKVINKLVREVLFRKSQVNLPHTHTYIHYVYKCVYLFLRPLDLTCCESKGNYFLRVHYNRSFVNFGEILSVAASHRKHF